MNLVDVFNSDAWSMITMTEAVNEADYKPELLGRMGIFEEVPVATDTVVVEKRGDVLELVPTAERGAPGTQVNRDKRNALPLQVPHLPTSFTVRADEVRGIRAFGSTDDMETVETVRDEKLRKAVRRLELTLENLRLGAIKGQLLDADGSTILDLFTAFDVSQEAEVDFELDDAATKVRLKCSAIRRTMAKNLKMGGSQDFPIHALCGDTFFDNLINHADVKTAYERFQAGEALRQDYTYGRFFFAGIMFHNYRGTDDGSTVGVNTNKAQFFPQVEGLFRNYFAPADTMSTVNTLGLPFYVIPTIDAERPTDPKWIGADVQSNPLPICVRPKVLMIAKQA